jgi:hypothetical protein
LLNVIDYVLDTAGRSEIRLYKESRSQAWSRRRARGEAIVRRFELSGASVATIAKNDKRIAVGHILPQEIVIREMFEPSGRAG